jgi:hypothetical protein
MRGAVRGITPLQSIRMRERAYNFRVLSTSLHRVLLERRLRFTRVLYGN